MLGVVFSEFMELVESKFGDEMLEDILDDVVLESGGAYTAVGSYSHDEIVKLVVALSKKSGIPIDDLVEVFGGHLLTTFASKYPGFFEEADSSFKFLSSVDQYIHKEVLKIYPQAELPRFESNIVNDQKMTLTYSSVRPFSNLAKGLIKGTLEYYGETATLEVEDLSTPDMNIVKFTIVKC